MSDYERWETALRAIAKMPCLEALLGEYNPDPCGCASCLANGALGSATRNLPQRFQDSGTDPKYEAARADMAGDQERDLGDGGLGAPGVHRDVGEAER